MGLFATALAIGGVFGPLLSGFAIQHLGFRLTFSAFAGLARQVGRPKSMPRKEAQVSGWTFFKTGVLVMPPGYPGRFSY